MLNWRSHQFRELTSSSCSSKSCQLRLPVQRSSSMQRANTLKCHAATKCLYTVLGVTATASADEIKVAYRKIALKLHPDVNPAPDAAEAFKSAKEAYEVLSNPQERQQYNQQRTRQARSRIHNSYSSSSGSSSTSTSSRRGRAQPVYDDIIYEYLSVDGLFDEIDPSEMPGFHGWYSKSGSWQSSWQANRKKQQARQQQQQQQQQQQAWRQKQDTAAVEALLSQLDRETRIIIAQVLGQHLEHMESLEELMELVAALEVLRAQGIRPSSHMFAKGAAATTGSNRSRPTAGSSSHTDSSTSSWSSRSSSGSARDRGTAASDGSRSRQAGQAGSSGRQARDSQASATSSSRSSTGSRKRSANRTSSRSRGNSRSKSGSRSSKLPPFDEMSFAELLAAMEDAAHPATAAAARSWAASYAAMPGANPALAADLEALLTLDFLAEDWGSAMGIGGSGTAKQDWTDVQEANARVGADAERRKYRARVGSAGDYVTYSSSMDDDSSDDEVSSDVGDVLEDVAGWINLDELIERADAAYWVEFDSYDD